MLKFVLAFLFFCAAELYLILQVGRVLGALAVLGLLAAGFVLGLVILNQRGAMNIMHFALGFGKNQGAGRAAGLMCWVAAAWLFMFPGFISDGLAVLLLLPPVQNWLGRAVGGYVGAKAGRLFGYGRQAGGKAGRTYSGGEQDAGEVFEVKARVVSPEEDGGRGGPYSGLAGR